MKIILHLISKDLRRMAASTGVYLLLLALMSAAAIRYLHFSSQEFDNSILSEMVFMTATVLNMVIPFLLTASLVREDPPRDASAFWITRPVSGVQLLAAKLGAILIVVILPPFLAVLPWWVGEGFGLHFMLSAGAVMLVLQSLVILLALLGSFFIKRDSSPILLLIVMTTLVVLFVFVLTTTFDGPKSVLRSIPYALSETRQLLGLFLLLMLLACSCVHFFLTRRLARSLAIAGAAFGLSAIVIFAWPWQTSLLWIKAESAQYDRIGISDFSFRAGAHALSAFVQGKVSGLLPEESLRTLSLEALLGSGEPQAPVKALSIRFSHDGDLPTKAALFGSDGRSTERLASLSLLRPPSKERHPIWFMFYPPNKAKGGERIPTPELKGTWIGRVSTTRTLLSLPLHEEASVVGRSGLCSIDSIRILDKGRIEVQVSECITAVGGSAPKFHIIDPESGGSCELARARDYQSVFVMGTRLVRGVYAFNIGQLGMSPFPTRRELLGWLGSLQVVKVGQEAQDRVIREIVIPAGQIMMPVMDKAKADRLKDILGRP